MRQLSIQITTKVNHYRSMYGIQHKALAHTEQKAIKGPKITSVKPFKQENQWSYTCLVQIHIDKNVNA